MASLIVVRRGVDIVGHCDAVCYDAQHDDCVCSGCLGANHGIGLEQAIVNTRAMHAVWLTAHRAVDPTVDFELDEAVQHLPLFEIENL